MRSHHPSCPTPYPRQLVHLLCGPCCFQTGGVLLRPESRFQSPSETKPAVRQTPIQLSITPQSILLCLHRRYWSSAVGEDHHWVKPHRPHTHTHTLISVVYSCQKPVTELKEGRRSGLLRSSSLRGGRVTAAFRLHHIPASQTLLQWRSVDGRK